MIQSEKRILFLAKSSLKRENPQLWGSVSRNVHKAVPSRLTISSTEPSAAQVADGGWRRPRPTPAARARVTCGVSARSRRAQGRGRAEARPHSRAPGGSVRFGRRTRMPARPPVRSPERTGQRGDCYPIIATCTVATMQAGPREPRAGNRKAEPGSAASPAREPSTFLRARVGGRGATHGGRAVPRGWGRKGTS